MSDRADPNGPDDPSAPGFVTVRQLRMLACFEAALGEVLGITLMRNGERRRDGRFRFGEEEDVPGTPYVELQHLDRLGGDTYSGDSTDVDAFRLRNVHHDDGRPVHLELRSEDHSVAGRCLDVVSSLPEERRLAFAEAYDRHWAARTPPSPDFTWMLHPDERTGRRAAPGAG